MKKFLLVAGLGYFIAVLVSVFVTLTIFLAPTVLPDQGRFGSFFSALNDGIGLFLVGMVYTFITALPGYAITLTLAAKNHWHGWKYYCLGGALTALLAHFILGTFLRGANLELYLIFACSIPGGVAGAFAYFLWRRKILSAMAI